VQRPVRRAGVKPLSVLAILSLGAGLLTAAAALPVIGVTGVVARDAARTFNDMPVAGLGEVPSRSELLDSSGHLLAYYYPGFPHPVYRVPVSLDQIAPVMRQAIVAIEDSRFWSHGAFDLRGTLRALTYTLSGQAVQGGSDLAQQYVKNACILTAKTMADQQQCTAETPIRKLRELRIAADIARQLTRRQLLDAYLNVAYFENQSYGVEVAAQFYFSTSAAHLTLTQAAMLAGLVENPAAYDPVTSPAAALARRNTVLQQMVKSGDISQATANLAGRQPLGLHISPVPLQTGCTSPQVKWAAFFCDYVLAVMQHDSAYHQAYSELTTTGGLKIYTTVSAKDQHAAQAAVNYVLPYNNYVNPNHDVDTEVMIEPGTGYVRAIAVDRPYGFGPGQDSIDYAVDAAYNGGAGVQTGSSSKIFTLVTALRQGLPFSFHLKVKNGMYVGGMTSCSGLAVNPFQVFNADGSGENGNIPLYYGTAQSINAFYVSLEAHVGLCNVVKTAIAMGLHRADGKSLLSWVGKPWGPNSQPPADYLSSFTLGSVNVSPMSMAAAYATVASGGIYCHPIAIRRITDLAGRPLPVESAGCHRVVSQDVANAANYVLQGVLTSGTAAGRGIGRPAAAKTGTANDGYYAAFAGYTPTLVGYVSVFNPTNPTGAGKMLGCPQATYRPFPGGYVTCSGQMYGDMAPGSTWQYSFLHAALGPALNFGYPPAYFQPGAGQAPAAPPQKPKKKVGGHH